jgi:serine/threonine protein kinase
LPLEPPLRGTDALVEEPRPQIGKDLPPRIGPYELREALGVGGMGHVYKAEHRLMKRIVALKLVGRLRRGRHAAGMRNRFRREVEAAGRVRHPGIVTAFDAGAARGWLYLAMEYLDGIDLQRFVEAHGPLPFDLAGEIVRQTAEALHHAHERGLVHRDIKPSNLMLTAPGVTVKLLDLGLARWTDRADGDTDDELCGTPDFMAPEWGQTSSSADVRGDLYSLGCTFYYLLAGRVPYPGGGWTEKLLRHGLDEPTPLRQLRPQVPESLALLVERLMAREVERRPESAAAVVADLSVPHSTPLAIQREEKNAAHERPSTRSPRRGIRFVLAAGIAVLLGVAAAGIARRMTPLPIHLPTPPAPHSEPVFSIVGRSEEFASLAKTIAAAHDGDILVLRGPGPFLSPPISWKGKALTLRAADVTRPRLKLQATDEPWQALLQTDRALTLEGLDLALAERTSVTRGKPATPLIRCTFAPLSLTNCRLHGGAEGAAIVARNPSEVILRGCTLDAGAVGLSVEVGQCDSTRLHISDTKLSVRDASGAALSLWAADIRQETPTALQLYGNTIECGRFAALRNLPASLTIEVRDNRFSYRTALLSYSGYTGRDAWRATDWRDGGNSYRGPEKWLWVEGKPLAEPRP